MSTKSVSSFFVHFLIIGQNMGRRKRSNTPLKIFFVFDCKPSQSFGNLRYEQFRKRCICKQNVALAHFRIIQKFRHNSHIPRFGYGMWG